MAIWPYNPHVEHFSFSKVLHNRVETDIVLDCKHVVAETRMETFSGCLTERSNFGDHQTFHTFLLPMKYLRCEQLLDNNDDPNQDRFGSDKNHQTWP